MRDGLGFGFIGGAVFSAGLIVAVSDFLHRYEKRICQEWAQTECEKKWRPVEEATK